MNVTEYIKKNSLNDLIERFKLKANYHKKYPNLVQLCYHQLDTPKNSITDNCRGLILDAANDYKVISFPFTRFSDYDFKNDKNNKIDLSNSKYLEKIDGSIVTLYYYNDEWNVSTKGLPDANGIVKGLEITYNDYFCVIWNNLKYELPKDTNHCYIFEIKVLNDSFLVKHDEVDITLIGIRNLETFEEVDIFNTDLISNWKIVKTFEFNDINNVIDYVYNVDPTIFEGFVAIDNNFNRVKIKSPQYEAINLIRCNNYTNQEEWERRKEQIGKDNIRRYLDIVRTNNHETFLDLDKYSSNRGEFEIVKQKYKEFVVYFSDLIKSCENLEGKELGLKLKSHKDLTGYVFAYNSGKYESIEKLIRTIDLKKLQHLVNV